MNNEFKLKNGSGCLYCKGCGRQDKQLRLLAEDFTRTISKQYTECNLSLSAGVYIVDGENSSDYESMMKKADTALYKSKRNGKSQYSWFVENQD